MTNSGKNSTHKTSVPIIDITALRSGKGDQQRPALEIEQACREYGFFYIVGHGVDSELQLSLERISKQFFRQDLATKQQIRMAVGGRAWRGYFPVGDELTSGKPDLKEGLYFGHELDNTDPRVQSDTPLHGPNLFPDNLPEFKDIILSYMEALTQVGHCLMQGLSISLGLGKSYFSNNYTYDPLTLFRIFHYPPGNESKKDTQWGAGEHTDYGVLTILKQDHIGGLQIKSKGNWIEAPPMEGTFICNIGDMLDRMTGGYYRSTAHRVINRSSKGRFSYPFFFDPNFEATIKPLDLSGIKIITDDKESRWDKASVHEFEGTYGEYILSKVAKVFPELLKN